VAHAARYNLASVKADAAHHWPAIINRVAGIDDDYLTTEHGRCPKCDGGHTTDRWRVFGDFEETGGAVCNQCGKFGDGFALLQWYLGIGFPEAVRLVAEFLGTKPDAARGKGPNAKTNGATVKNVAVKAKVNGAPVNGSLVSKPEDESLSTDSDSPFAGYRTLESVPWNDLTVATWCFKKPGMTPIGCKKAGAEIVKYRKRYVCVAFPVVSGGRRVGWTIYEATNKLLPDFRKGSPEVAKWLKVKTIKARDLK
jgi:hypothetical protein